VILRLAVLVEHRLVTHTHTDRQTQTDNPKIFEIFISALCVLPARPASHSFTTELCGRVSENPCGQHRCIALTRRSRPVSYPPRVGAPLLPIGSITIVNATRVPREMPGSETTETPHRYIIVVQLTRQTHALTSVWDALYPATLGVRRPTPVRCLRLHRQQVGYAHILLHTHNA